MNKNKKRNNNNILNNITKTTENYHALSTSINFVAKINFGNQSRTCSGHTSSNNGKKGGGRKKWINAKFECVTKIDTISIQCLKK
jgi:hypothetical protein